MSRRPFAAAYGPWAIVAGGSGGLGAAFADQIARHGVNLVLVARRPGPLKETADRMRREHQVDVITVTADLADPGTLGQIQIAAAGADIGLVVANAASAPQGKFLDIPQSELATVVDLNVRASMLLARAFLPAMARRGHGGLIFVSSLAGLQGVPGLAAYSATKAFLITLGESLWAELRPAGVDVLTVCAGAVATLGYEQAARRRAPGMLQRLTPRRAAIAVFGRASAAALKP